MKNFSFDFNLKKEIAKNFVVLVVCVAVSTAFSYLVVSHSLKDESKQGLNSPNSNLSEVTGEKLLSDTEVIANIAEKISPSVVHINTEIEQTIIDDSQEFFFNNQEFFKHFFGTSPFGEDMQPQPFKRRSSATGSGFIISSDGYILTNFHVVQNASKITVKTEDEKEYTAKLIGKDKYSDLAVIKINEHGLRPAMLGDSSKIRPGEWAIAIGSPQGLDHTVTLGIVSALSRIIPELSNVSFIQTDAAINPGNSGGPLLNIKGEVIGINTAIMGTAQNIGFAIPVNVAKNIVNQLKTGQIVGHPWIGIAMSPVTKELTSALGIPANIEGVIISKVMPNSPADNIGLVAGDIIQRIDGKRYTDPKEVQAYVKSKKVGDEINIQILQDGNIVGKRLKIGNWQEN